jgi:ketosteroid isomerase-like protein
MKTERSMKATILLALGGSVALLSAAGEDEIQRAEKEWAAAVTSLDYRALDRILGEHLIYAHSTGSIENKTEYLRRLRSGAQKYDAIEHQSVTIRLYGETAVAHVKVRMTGKSNGNPFDDRLMAMHFWVKQGGAWRLVAHQTTKLP